MATIEPRLIHLLNESTTPQLSNNGLPSLHSLLLPPESPDRAPPTLDREGSHRVDGHYGRHAPPGGPTSGAIPPVPPHPHPAHEASYATHRNDEDRRAAEARFAGASLSYPMRLLLGEDNSTAPATGTSSDPSHSFASILDDGGQAALLGLEDAYTKKRSRAINVKDDFVQLPQPVKKQKAAQQAHVMPPIINGLLEPPPDAALFPPISSGSLDGIDDSHMKLLHDFNHGVTEEKAVQRPASEPDQYGGKGRKRANKPRRKWSNEETNHLLLGVDRHGVGKWTSILEDPEFKFNDRSAGDLKDRFRTCCPEELRDSRRDRLRESRSGPKQKTKKGISLKNILIDEEELSSREPAASPTNESDSAPKKKSRAHRKKMEDLAVLGIHGPFKRSHRRERRPFTEQDDREILEGLEFYGPAWTKIQRDSRFHLASRQPTDLRDRVRNKYPSIYQRIEKTPVQLNDSRNNAILEPSINTMVDGLLHAAHRSQYTGNNGSREDFPRWSFQTMDTAESSQIQPPPPPPPPPQQQLQQQVSEFTEPSALPVIGGEMDISRLLLDDPKGAQAFSRYGMDETSLASSPMAVTYGSRKR